MYTKFIAVFDSLQFLRQLKTGNVLVNNEKELTESQFSYIQSLDVLLYGVKTPNYIFDLTYIDGIPCADGYLRPVTWTERLRWLAQGETYTLEDNIGLFEPGYYQHRLQEGGLLL